MKRIIDYLLVSEAPSLSLRITVSCVRWSTLLLIPTIVWGLVNHQDLIQIADYQPMGNHLKLFFWIVGSLYVSGGLLKMEKVSLFLFFLQFISIDLWFQNALQNWRILPAIGGLEFLQILMQLVAFYLLVRELVRQKSRMV